MKFAAICATPLRCVSKEFLAEAINKPSTRAVIVPIRPMPSLTTSLDSALKWLSGKMARRTMPKSVPATMHANTMQLVERGFMKRSP